MDAAAPRDDRPASGASSTDLVQRLRAALAARRPREVSMFGGTSFMVDDRMVAAARRGGDLLLRIDPAQHDELVAAGANPAMMGTDRPMGAGWITVPPDALPHDSDLHAWLAHALAFHASQA